MNNKNKGNRILMLLIIGGGGVYCGATSASTMFLYI